MAAMRRCERARTSALAFCKRWRSASKSRSVMATVSTAPDTVPNTPLTALAVALPTAGATFCADAPTLPAARPTTPTASAV